MHCLQFSARQFKVVICKFKVGTVLTLKTGGSSAFYVMAFIVSYSEHYYMGMPKNFSLKMNLLYSSSATIRSQLAHRNLQQNAITKPLNLNESNIFYIITMNLVGNQTHFQF
jgi:hypothetical protein